MSSEIWSSDCFPSFQLFFGEAKNEFQYCLIKAKIKTNQIISPRSSREVVLILIWI
jgi:hypothetical protein